MLFSSEIFGGDPFDLGNNSRDRLFKKLIGGKVMKVVIFKSPKILCGFLRMIFGIKKEST
ncbi:MAG: stage V sporulation protein SpoVM [Clostridia bacterium]|nr:stage V sporulation protein SpoVM [Clostridia bacterium]